MSLINLKDKFDEINMECIRLPKTGIVLSAKFQQYYSEYINSSGSQGGYSAVVFDNGYAVFTSRGNKTSFVTNAGFILASRLAEYLKALREYKSAISLHLGEISKAQIDDFKSNGKVSDTIEKLLKDNTILSKNDKDNIEKFLSDYAWWGGGKTIDRLDFYVSALMKCGSLQAETQSAIAEIAEQLLDHPDILKELKYTINPTTPISVSIPADTDNSYNGYLSAIRTKPFVLLAGISGTGKSRLVRQLAKSTCSKELSDDQNPGNFDMIQVRPNWHDSTELMGYVSRISGKPEYVITDFVRFLTKAWLFKDTPFFLCLDEMNLAPVEQYFAEYLSVIETRQKNSRGEIITDVLVKLDESVRGIVVDSLLKPYWDDAWKGKLLPDTVKKVKEQFLADYGIRIPPNLVVMGTVNMDETTFSFSRKVLDRAMSFELNGVNLRSGLTDERLKIVHIEAINVACNAVAASDIYENNKVTCDKVLDYLKILNSELENTPFKIAYRTRNEVMIYVWERIKYEGTSIATALDEATSMKILSRIEGDEQRISESWLQGLSNTIDEQLKTLDAGLDTTCTLSLTKLAQMRQQLKRGYVSFWS